MGRCLSDGSMDRENYSADILPCRTTQKRLMLKRVRWADWLENVRWQNDLRKAVRGETLRQAFQIHQDTLVGLQARSASVSATRRCR